MEYLKTYYSLEKHLEETIKFNPQFEILNSIWKLNKKNLSGALSNVNHYYPHYSLHDKSHSATIINNIELFLGEDRIKRLSPTNTWLLLMASFTHDLGMVIFQEVIEKEWSSTNFQEFLKDIATWDDPDLGKSGKILCGYHDSLSKGKDIEFSPIEIKNAVTLAVAEYMRRFHHKRSSDMLKGIDKTFHDVANAFYSDQIPNRLLSLLGDVAFLHGVEFYEIFKKLEFESNGISNDKINPRFIAAMLRLGDLLDIDDGRFNQFTLKVYNSPASSQEHQKKHSSIKHFLINPEAIEITADCGEDEVYRLARSWFDWLELEIENLNKEWSNIAPADLGGSAPRIPKGRIKVFSKGQIIDERFLNLRFQVSNQKIFEILEGGSIYDKAEFTFIRELVQNALDATKIQIWREILRGTYDFAFRKAFEDENLTHEEIIEKIHFPNDIPEEILSSYKITLNVAWKCDKKDELIIEVIDEGTGIAEEDLLRMTQKVGESRKGNFEYKHFLASMPFWLRPTGAFGVGLQSLFIIVDSFKVETKFEGESGKEIIFRSAKKNKYSSLKENLNNIRRGTKVSLSIPTARFPEVFGTSFNWDIISDYDHFNDDYGNIYVHKIKAYVFEVLSQVNSLNVNFFRKKLIAPNNLDRIESINSKAIVQENISANIYLHEEKIIFQFFENIIGSEFHLNFFSNEGQDIDRHGPIYHVDYYVRDIPVKTNRINYHILSYTKLWWNFMSPESDKILSLTREKFINKNMSKIEKEFCSEVIPKALEIGKTLLNEVWSKIKMQFSGIKTDLSYLYFKILLTYKANDVIFDKVDTELTNHKLNTDFASLKDNEAITYEQFFDYKNLVIPIPIFEGLSEKMTLKNKRDLIENIDLKNNLIIWAPYFFPLYLRKNYRITEIKYYSTGRILYLTSTKAKSDKVKVKSGIEHYYLQFTKSSGLSERFWNYSLEKFAETLSVYNHYGSGFENFPYLSDTSIISPFSSSKEFDIFYDQLKLENQGYDLKDIKSKIHMSAVASLVKVQLLNWIKKHRPEGTGERTDNEILSSYHDLIAEIVFAKFKTTKDADAKSH